jgi:hypothetical protein
MPQETGNKVLSPTFTDVTYKRNVEMTILRRDASDNNNARQRKMVCVMMTTTGEPLDCSLLSVELQKKKKKETIPIERSPPVSEASANFSG